MKVKNVILSITLSAVLIAGVGYTAYHSMSRDGTNLVEVAPVKNMATDYDYYDEMEDTIYGSVTSMASQNIDLDDEYDVDEVYVKEGDSVKEGDPLFSYDMRLAEIELQADEIEVATLELALNRYQEELEKYQNGAYTAEDYNEDYDEDDLLDTLASLVTIRASAAAENEILIEDIETEPSASAVQDTSPADEITIQDVTPVNVNEETSASTESQASTDKTNEIVIESVETVSSDNNIKDETYRNAVMKYEYLMETLEWFENENGKITWTDNTVEAIKKAVKFYRNNLADKIEKESIDADGNPYTVTVYELKNDVINVLSYAELIALNDYIDTMEEYLDDYESEKKTEDESESKNETELIVETENTSEETELDIIVEETESEDTDHEIILEETEETQLDIILEATESDGIEENSLDELYNTFLQMFNDMENNPTEENMKDLLRFYFDNFTNENTDIILQKIGYGSLIERIYIYGMNGLNTSTKDILGEERTENLENYFMLLCLDYGSLLLTQVDVDLAEDTLSTIEELEAMYRIYEEMPLEMQNSIYNLESLLALFEAYGIGDFEYDADEDETEDWDDWDDDDWDYDDWDYDDLDYDDWDDDDWDDDDIDNGDTDYDDIIKSIERNIRECELSIREAKLNTEEQQRIVDGKIVTSAMDGIVTSVDDDDDEYGGDYFIKISNTSGLYARGVISELELLSVNIGDTVSGITEDGENFTAVIKEISDYPDASGSQNVYSEGNTNASYYTFYALIDDPEGITEGDADLTLSNAFAEDNSSIWLDNYFVRTDSAGNSYVYVDDGDGKLEKRYVSTGHAEADWAIEITGGLSKSDMIAFPYGDKVYEGASTKKVDMLEELYS